MNGDYQRRLQGGWRAVRRASRVIFLAFCLAGLLSIVAADDGEVPQAATLRNEVSTLGWIAFSAKSPAGDWDLFAIRPDGSRRTRITATPGYHEAGVRFSPDGKRLLYYRMDRTNALDNNTYGTFELFIAAPDGSGAVSYGSECHWACWSPDGTQIACLAPSGIKILDLETRKVDKQLPRKGLVQQLGWSPDGRYFTGTANGLGPYWTIGCLEWQNTNWCALSELERYNCTPDWFPDARRVIYSRGIIPEKGGYAELWVADRADHRHDMVYAEEKHHLYGGATSPDGRYLLFTRSVGDLGKVDPAQTMLTVIRFADTPMAGGPSDELARRYPQARVGERLDLGPGWEPHWTYADVYSK